MNLSQATEETPANTVEEQVVTKLDETRKRRRILQRDMQRLSGKFEQIKQKYFEGKDLLLVKEIQQVQSGQHESYEVQLKEIEAAYKDKVAVAEKRFAKEQGTVDRLIEATTLQYQAEQERIQEQSVFDSKLHLFKQHYKKEGVKDDWYLTSAGDVAMTIGGLTAEEAKGDMQKIAEMLK